LEKVRRFYRGHKEKRGKEVKKSFPRLTEARGKADFYEPSSLDVKTLRDILQKKGKKCLGVHQGTGKRMSSQRRGEEI